MSLKKIFLAGFGGQGVLLIGQMLSYAAMYADKEVTWMPSYGPEMRGGTANCTVCISDKQIASPVISSCDIFVAMNGPSLAKFEDMLVPGGHLFVNTSVCQEKPKRDDIIIHNVDTAAIAEKIGVDKVSNMVMLGAILRKTDVVDIDIMDKVFEKVLSGKKAKLIPVNKEALFAWDE